MARVMRRFGKWHIWLGWLTGVPLLLWCVSGLVMVARPNAEVRGADLRRELAPATLPAGAVIALRLPAGERARPVVSAATRMEQGRVVTRLTYADGGVDRLDEGGRRLAPFSGAEARSLVARGIRGGDRVRAVRAFAAGRAPAELRQPGAVWQVALTNGTNVYVGRDSGDIIAVRTRWWRVYDFFWGLHIMDLQTRENTHHPILILFAVLALAGSLLGTVLLFRRRQARVRPS